jgi:hypothetical protein
VVKVGAEFEVAMCENGKWWSRWVGNGKWEVAVKVGEKWEVVVKVGTE